MCLVMTLWIEHSLKAGVLSVECSKYLADKVACDDSFVMTKRRSIAPNVYRTSINVICEGIRKAVMASSRQTKRRNRQ